MSTVSRTTNFNLPLPVPSNLLADDVVNIRDATIAIDTQLNIMPTNASMNTAISTAIANLIDTAPASLDTLNELAAAINDDPNFGATISTLQQTATAAQEAANKATSVGLAIALG